MLAVQEWGPKFKSQHPHKKLGINRDASVTPALREGNEVRRVAEACGHQLSSRFMERFCLKRIKRRMREQNTHHPLVSGCVHVHITCPYMCTHHTHSHIQKNQSWHLKDKYKTEVYNRINISTPMYNPKLH